MISVTGACFSLIMKVEKNRFFGRENVYFFSLQIGINIILRLSDDSNCCVARFARECTVIF